MALALLVLFVKNDSELKVLVDKNHSYLIKIPNGTIYGYC